MVTFNDFAFAAPPHTGISWFMEAAKHAGQLPRLEFAWQCHTPFHEGYRGFSVSLIRHPYTWLQALYFNPQEDRLEAIPEVDWIVREAKKANYFHSFVNTIVEHPGCIGSMFGAYQATSVLRVEDFPWAAMSLFELIGAPAEKVSTLRNFLPDFALDIPPIDQTAKLRRMIVKSEAEFCQQYEYF